MMYEATHSYMHIHKHKFCKLVDANSSFAFTEMDVLQRDFNQGTVQDYCIYSGFRFIGPHPFDSIFWPN